MTLRVRLTLFFSLLLLTLLTTFSFLIFSWVKDDALKTADSYLRSLTLHEWEHLDLPSHQGINHEDQTHYRNVHLRIYREGELLYDAFPKNEAIAVGKGLDLAQEKIFHTIEGFHGGHGYQIVGFYDVSLVLRHLSLFRKTLFLGCVLALLVIAPISFLMTGLLLKPFRELALKTSTLTAKDLSFRLPASHSKDEFGMLATNFNLLFDRLEKSFTQVRDFAVNASHEIRTPLAVIISQIERAVRRPPETASESRVVFEKVLRSAMDLRSITNQLFVLAEVERLGTELNQTEIEVGEVIENIVSNLKESLGERTKEIKIEKLQPQIKLHVKQDLFTSIVTNLIENAIKYSKEKIRVSFGKDKKGFRLTIEDDGPGISLEDRTKVFEPFHRGDAGKDPSKKGHGLGLSIVRACVEAEQGKITLQESIWGGLSAEVWLGG